MKTPKNVAEAAMFGDSQFGASVCDGVARIDEVISSELAQGEEIIRDAVLRPLQAESMRLRPLFTVLAAQFGPDPNAWQVTVAGAAIELMHQATLSHDDVVDESEVHPVGSSTTTRWHNNIAILVGDYRFAMTSRLGSRLGPRAFAILAETFAELVTGQMRHTHGTADHVDPMDHYLRCVGEKSGSLVAAAAQLGATFSGASEEDTVRLSRLGRLVGTASQISEDIVAIDGNSLASPNDDVAEVFTWLRSAAGTAKAKEVVATYAAQAREEVGGLPDCAARRSLLTLVDSTVVLPAT